MNKHIVWIVAGTVVIDIFLVFAFSKNYRLQRKVALTKPVPEVFTQNPRFTVSPGPPEAYTPEPLTLDGIFREDHSWTATLSAGHVRTVVVSGDIIPARSANNAASIRNDFMWPYKNIASVLAEGDITLVNLETPLLNDCLPTTTGMIFCGKNSHIEGLSGSGVDVASLANNHAGNFGEAGIEETVRNLNEKGIDVTGLGKTVYKTVRGMRIAFLGYNDIPGGIAPIRQADPEIISRDIAEARKHADLVLVMYHWGVEYVRQPGTRQTELAHTSIDAGADLVLGNHPHWIQPVEFYNGRLIIYAHGNTVFDQMWSEETKYGVIGRYTFYDTTLVDAEYIPTYIIDYGQPTVLAGDKKKSVLKMLQDESLKLEAAAR